MNMEDRRRIAAEASETLKILANPNRLIALYELLDKELSVGELAKILGLRDQAMSQQLAILRAKGFVATRRSGQTIYYYIARDDIKTILKSLYTDLISKISDTTHSAG